MKKKEERMEKQMNEVMAENKRLVEPLQRAKEEVEELRKELSNKIQEKKMNLIDLYEEKKLRTEDALQPD